jgi:hypothetical protein
MDVVSHFIVKNLQGRGIGWIAMAAWDFGVGAAAEFVVLDPKVRLEYLQSRWEAKERRVSR